MDIDQLFRIVFKNKVIRKEIFKFVAIRNNGVNSKKYGRINIKWCVKNNHFNLLIYKFLKDEKKNKQFTTNYFHYLLEHNTNPLILKQVFQTCKHLIPTCLSESSKIIETCSLGKSKLLLPIYGSFVEKNQSYRYENKQAVIKYLIRVLKIEPTKQTLNNLCIDGENMNFIKSLFYNGHYSIKEDVDVGLVYCTLKSSDLPFFKFILENNPTLKEQLISSVKYNTTCSDYILRELLNKVQHVEFRNLLTIK